MTINGSRNRVKFLNIYIQCDSLKLKRCYFFDLYEQLEIPLTVARQIMWRVDYVGPNEVNL